MRNHKHSLMIILGTRPELIRFSPILQILKHDRRFKLTLVHTGQHYSFNMDKIFFNQLDLPDPHFNLNLGPLSPNEQIGKTITGLEKPFKEFKPEIVCVWGDTNSSLAAAIAAVKAEIPVAHVEAGYRSYDLRMPEEVNRKLIDHCSSLLFPFCADATRILLSEGVSGRIKKVGNPLLDIFLNRKEIIPQTNILEKLNLRSPYILVTCHRAENVDNPRTLKKIITAFSRIKKYQLVFPIHPRTLSRIKSGNLLGALKKVKNIIAIDPIGYQEMTDLLLGSHMVVTDSGGLQVEAFFANKPCVTIRKSTEWTQTVKYGTNFLTNPEIEDINEKINWVLSHHQQICATFNKGQNPYGNGHGADEIIENIFTFLEQKNANK